MNYKNPPAEHFAKLRKERGFRSAEALAEASGLTRQMITNFETGRKAEFSIQELVALCRAMKVPPHAIFPELAEFADLASDYERWEVERAKLELMKDFQEFMLTRQAR